MTIDDVKTRLQAIRERAHDDEWAHITEDELRRDVLRFIAEHAGDSQTREIAAAALESGDIEFARRCA